MKNFKIIVSLIVAALVLSCSSENDLIDLSALGTNKYSALTTITQDNTGNVTFMPRGEGVTQYEIYFGDGTVAPAYVRPGSTTTHKYKEVSVAKKGGTLKW
jgi:hypothetical protein